MRRAAKLHYAIHHPRRGKRNYFYRNWQFSMSEYVDRLGRICNDKKKLRGRSDDLLSEEFATAAFYKVKGRRYLVSAIDGEIESKSAFWLKEWDALALSEFPGSKRGGDPRDAQPLVSYTAAQAADEMRDGSSAAYTNTRPVRNPPHRGFCRELLFIIKFGRRLRQIVLS